MRTRATPQQAYEVLADLDGYSSWLPRSLAYRATSRSGAPAPDGEYVDSTGFGRLTGRVIAREPDRRLVFEQTTPHDRLRLRIVYDIAPAPASIRIDRTGVITTRRLPRSLHRLIVVLIRRENRRTMRRLGAHLDQIAHPRSTTPTRSSQEES